MIDGDLTLKCEKGKEKGEGKRQKEKKGEERRRTRRKGEKGEGRREKGEGSPDVRSRERACQCLHRVWCRSSRSCLLSCQCGSFFY